MSDPVPQKFEPFVPASTTMAEFTPKAVILGVIFGLIFGAATVYLALTAGLTVSASIPIAVLAIAVFQHFGKSTILENNIVQTIGSAGESIAAGVAFTIPALIFLSNGEQYFNYFEHLHPVARRRHPRRAVHGAAAPRADRQGARHPARTPRAPPAPTCWSPARRAARSPRRCSPASASRPLYKIPMTILGLWKETPTWSAARDSAFPRATVDCDVTPEYLGVGYIIGPRIAGVLVAGGILVASWC